MKSIYNEKRYLDGDIDSLKYFEKRRKIYNNDKEKSLELNKDVIKYYDIYIDYIVEELLKLDLDSSIDYSVALGYLINKGYLSEGFNFESKVSNNEIIGKLGVSILLGSGCCRNISAMHEDVFKKLNIDIIPFYCYQGTGFLKGLNKEANHIINLVDYKNNLYGIDLYNDSLLYHFKNSFIMKSLSSEMDAKIRYKPYYEMIFDNKDLDKIKERIKLFNDCSKKDHISYFQYEMGIRYEIENYLFEKKDELNDFHNKTKLLRKNIISRIDRNKR